MQAVVGSDELLLGAAQFAHLPQICACGFGVSFSLVGHALDVHRLWYFKSTYGVEGAQNWTAMIRNANKHTLITASCFFVEPLLPAAGIARCSTDSAS